MIESIFYWMGFAVFFIAATVSIIYALCKFYMWSMNRLGKIFKHLWIIVEYAYYRHDFKEFIKDKERIQSPEDLIKKIENQ